MLDQATCIPEMPVLNLDLDIIDLTEFSWIFFQPVQANAWIVPKMRPRPLSFVLSSSLLGSLPFNGFS
jgi:hypothetical protein